MELRLCLREETIFNPTGYIPDIHQEYAETGSLSSRPESREPVPMDGDNGSPLYACGDDILVVCLYDPAAAGEACLLQAGNPRVQNGTRGLMILQEPEEDRLPALIGM